MKSFIMGVYLLGVSLGNLFTAGVNFTLASLKDEQGKTPLDGSNYYLFFTVIMLVAAIAFAVYARRYRGDTYYQGNEAQTDASP